MFCRNCGKQINDSATFCRYCGQGVVRNMASIQSKAEVVSEPPKPPKEKKKKRVAAICIALMVCAGLIAGGIYIWNNGVNRSSSNQTYASTNNSSQADTVQNSTQSNPTQTPESEDVSPVNDTASSEATASPEPDNTKLGDAFTIMVYIIGSNLESDYGCASQDIYEMLSASWGDDVNVVIETGGAYQWRDYGISSNNLERYELRDGYINLKKTCPLQQMSTESALSDFISWGVSNYPARRYGLILWDHGGGLLNGYGADELYGGYAMSIPEITYAIQKSRVHFDFVGYDACLMAGFETAYALKDCADYLIASEEIETGIGWYYTDWLNYLGKNPELPMEELGRSIIDSMMKGNQNQNYENTSTLSLIDLSKMDEVYDAWQTYLEKLQVDLNGVTFSEQSLARTEARTYGDSVKVDQAGNIVGETHTDMMDMLDFIDQTALPGSFDIKNTIRSCIVYCNANISGSNGLSVYMPYYKPEKYSTTAVPALREIGFGDDYFTYFDRFGSYLAKGNPNISFSPTKSAEVKDAIKVTLPDLIKKDFKVVNGEACIPFTEEEVQQMQSIYMQVATYSERPKEIVYSCWGEDIVSLSKIHDMALWTGWDGVITLLFSDGADIYNDGNENIVFSPFSLVVDQGTLTDGREYAKVIIPAVLNGSTEIVINAMQTSDAMDILGYEIVDEDKWIRNEMLSFQPGDEIEFPEYLYLPGELDTLHLNTSQSWFITVGEGGLKGARTDLAKEQAGKQKYIYRYRIVDIYNNSHYTEWIWH